MTLRKIVLFVLLVAVLVGAGLTALSSLRRSDSSSPSGAPRLVFYTNPAATTPQLPLWACAADGELERLFRLEMRLWKSTEHLQTLVLAGEGDLWLGHIEGFARARQQGAPVVLLAVTGWRKMALVTRRDDISTLADLCGRTVPYAPPGSPALPIARALLGDMADQVVFQPVHPRKLVMQLIRGDADIGLLPEPVVTMLLDKSSTCHVAFNLEDFYAPRNRGRARMPLAGLAVHAAFAQRHPERVEQLLRILKTKAVELNRAPERAPELLPEAFSSSIPRRIVKQSLARDVIMVEAARDVEDEINAFLALVTPELGGVDTHFPKDFIWHGPQDSPSAPAPEKN
ncbi:MAG: ABC transporter substrate-binding protein [Lentisphaeria bacterium]|nr:ABC transporter substrate-binding protein [Lentisphaeria bacterium]